MSNKCMVAEPTWETALKIPIHSYTRHSHPKTVAVAQFAGHWVKQLKIAKSRVSCLPGKLRQVRHRNASLDTAISMSRQAQPFDPGVNAHLNGPYSKVQSEWLRTRLEASLADETQEPVEIAIEYTKENNKVTENVYVSKLFCRDIDLMIKALQFDGTPVIGRDKQYSVSAEKEEDFKTSEKVKDCLIYMRTMGVPVKDLLLISRVCGQGTPGAYADQLGEAVAAYHNSGAASAPEVFVRLPGEEYLAPIGDEAITKCNVVPRDDGYDIEMTSETGPQTADAPVTMSTVEGTKAEFKSDEFKIKHEFKIALRRVDNVLEIAAFGGNDLISLVGLNDERYVPEVADRPQPQQF